jgi:uncharacterized membrane protein YgcG
VGTYLLWTALGICALVLLIVMFTVFAKDNGRGPRSGGGRSRGSGRSGDSGGSGASGEPDDPGAGPPAPGGSA